MRGARPDLVTQEREALARLHDGLAAVDGHTLSALAAALDRDEARLRGGAWGSREDGEGCLLSLAAWELGLPDGEALMHRSIAAVRLPALFDHAWALMVRRTGDPEAARRVVHRLLRLALAEVAPEADEPVAAAAGGRPAG